MNTQTLRELMEFDHVVFSDGQGNVTDDLRVEVWAPESVILPLDDAGQATGAPLQFEGNWTALEGFAADGNFMSTVLHDSQFIGGSLEAHIRENAGFYVAMTIEGDNMMIEGDNDTEDSSGDHCGWCVLHMSTPIHVSYPHEPGYLIDCDACEFGPCVCDAQCFEPECDHVSGVQWQHSVPCVSVHCEHPEKSDES